MRAIKTSLLAVTVAAAAGLLSVSQASAQMAPPTLDNDTMSHTNTPAANGMCWHYDDKNTTTFNNYAGYWGDCPASAQASSAASTARAEAPRRPVRVLRMHRMRTRTPSQSQPETQSPSQY